MIRALVVGLGLLLLAFFLVTNSWWGDGPIEEETVVVVEEGTSIAGLGQQLANDGQIAMSPDRWRLLARVLGGSDPIRTGEFAIPAAASPADILDIVQHATPVQRMVTIPEGLPSVLVQEKLQAAPHLVGEAPLPPEGSVLPDTYSYQRGETREAVLARMTAAMDEALKELWPTRSKTSVVTTPQEAVTLASVVEKETAKADERPMVAGVLSNRVRLGMKLGADATTIYPITKGRPLGRMIRKSELADPNPYNTRAIAGLPAGPITNPGVDALKAVLAPAETDALYYVADGSGGHVFAKTLAEHNENAARWRALRKKRGK
ncbi:endolytic transglycosylase MltG [Sphingomicrobium nitratireducens]|uniref:endolytic transglycosylase MltG n=1 Tax=Sphingomicrobium nitratireducens TaxID=2964666 RepID=UPI00223ECED5|nr:endolytic transglycosylase MltG [Sphingomicrobium nitratireducens]